MAIKYSQRLLGNILSVVIPVGYMIATHLSWEGDRNGKLRMAIKHLGFWGGMAGTIFCSHRYGFRAKSMAKALPIFIGSGTFPILGYEVFRRIAAKAFPHQTTSAPIAIPEIQLPQQRSYQPKTFTEPTLESPRKTAPLSNPVYPPPIVPIYPYYASYYSASPSLNPYTAYASWERSLY